MSKYLSLIKDLIIRTAPVRKIKCYSLRLCNHGVKYCWQGQFYLISEIFRKKKKSFILELAVQPYFLMNKQKQKYLGEIHIILISSALK